jgi:hypothetical protein
MTVAVAALACCFPAGAEDAEPDWFALEGPRARVLFFVAHDCPISNRYAPEIRRICSEYRPRGVDCVLLYPDPSLREEDRRAHQSTFGLAHLTAAHDRAQRWVARTGVTRTPEAAVIGSGRRVLYRGRIDDRQAGWMQARSAPTRHDLRIALDEILAGRPVSMPRTAAVGCYIPPLPLAK